MLHFCYHSGKLTEKVTDYELWALCLGTAPTKVILQQLLATAIQYLFPKDVFCTAGDVAALKKQDSNAAMWKHQPFT